MKDLLSNALEAARSAGAGYADARFVRRKRESVKVKAGLVDYLDLFEEEGVGVRALVYGAWGFACASEPTKAAVETAARRAADIARASAAALKLPVRLDGRAPASGRYETPVEIDPFSIPLEKKIEFLTRLDRAMRGDKKICSAEASCECLRMEKLYMDTEGADIEQKITETGGGVHAVAADGNDVQTRSFPCAFGGNYATKGWEYIRELGLNEEAAARTAAEAMQLLTARPCPREETTVILDGNQMTLQVHESIGHPLELDRVFGDEASYAGCSFVRPEDRGRLKYGSPLMNVTASATTPGGLGTFGFDDEGVPAASTPLIRDGVFRDFLMSRESAARLGLNSNGCMRAESWNRIPLIRMINVNLEPGAGSQEELIQGVKRGIYMATNRSWSIDDRRLNFQFGCEIGWEIVDGKLGRMVKNPTYTGMTTQFWGNLDAVAGPEEWKMWGIPNCGKGQPGQSAHVGHGTAPARFKNVKVGVF